MKFDTKESDVTVVGDIKSNNVSIDTSNINFIVTILSTNLYSKPIESFIRETVSNAWDSHVEAGVTDPVLLELGEDTEGNYFCRIQDFGVGLSPERFDKVYKNIGSSTKRDDNNQIGGFGIGRFSALSYNDVVHITSNYEGKQYKYLMYKDGNQLSIDLLNEQDTDERNGLEVQVELKPGAMEKHHFYEAIKKQLVYFENLYFINSISDDTLGDEFNNFHIKKYNNFLVNDLDDNNRNIDLVLGKVRYPLRIEALTKKYFNYVSNYPISLVFNIGDLEVTPNREEILYSTKNVEAIEKVLDSALEELDEIFKVHSKKDFTSLSEYVEAMEHSAEAPLLTTADGVNRVYIKINSNELKITYKGQNYNKKDFLFIYKYIMEYNNIPVNYVLKNDKLVYLNSSLNINTIKKNLSSIYVCDVSSLNSMSKTYLRENAPAYSQFIHTTRPLSYFYMKYFRAIKNQSKYAYNNISYDTRIIKVILKTLAPNIFALQKFKDSTVPQSYIDAKKAEMKLKRALRKGSGTDWSQNVNLYDLRMSEKGSNLVTTTSNTRSLKSIKKKYKTLTIYSEKDDVKLRTLFSVLYNAQDKVSLVEVAPTRQKLLENFQNFVKLENFMDVKYKLLRQIGTARLIQKELPHLHQLYVIRNSIGEVSMKLQSLVVELENYTNKYLGINQSKLELELIEDIYNLCEDKNYFDEEIKGVLNSNLTMLKNAEILILLADYGSYDKKIPDHRINLAVDYIMARKLFRPDVAAVVKMKKETILNLKENENN